MISSLMIKQSTQDLRTIKVNDDALGIRFWIDISMDFDTYDGKFDQLSSVILSHLMNYNSKSQQNSSFGV